MDLRIRKIVTYVDETAIDMGKPLARTKRTALVAAVIANPFAGRFQEDLFPMIDAFAPQLGKLLAERVVAALGEPVEAYGKAAIVGLNGDVEVGSGIIHTLKFGNYFRAAAAATTLLPAVEKVGPAGCTWDVPLKHKTNDKVRSHHQTFTFSIPDAPLPDEIVVALVATNAGRPHPRIGDLSRETSLLDVRGAGP